MARHNELGKKGELVARKFLEEKGLTIVEANWRFERDEIDLIAQDGKLLVIVEVKTRSTDFFGPPEEAVNQRKEAFLIRATESYLDQNNLDCEVRFDIVAIVLNDRQCVVNHIEGAFYPE